MRGGVTGLRTGRWVAGIPLKFAERLDARILRAATEFRTA